MKYISLAVILLIAVQINAQQLSTYEDSLAYSVGVINGQQLISNGLKDVQLDVVQNAIKDVINEKDLLIQPLEAKQIMDKDYKKRSKQMSEANKLAGEAFLAENAKKEGITTLPSGLQYEVITEGTGKMHPELTDRVTTHYHGTLITGQVFDSSVERGEPLTFGLNQVITGWQEGLALMTEGAKWRLYVPYNMAYGERAAGPTIKPYSALIFEVELIKIN